MNKPLTDRELQLKRLKFRSWHRGWKETDIILGNFADEKLEGLSAPLVASYEALLEEDDDVIWAWIIGKTEAPEEFSEIISLIRIHSKA
jgi:antitoxin CptB